MSKPSNVDQYKKIYNDITRKGYCKIKLFTKDDINKAYINIQKKIHPDVSPETARLSAIVNEAKEVVLKNMNIS